MNWHSLAGSKVGVFGKEGAGKSTVTALLHNARGLGISLETANAIVLSHGHYDHTRALSLR